MSEIFLSIPGYNGRYEVSNFGNVRSCDRVVKSTTGQRCYKSQPITLITNKWGYVYVGLRIATGINQKTFVHVLVARTFMANPENKPCVNHKDGDKGNNSIENLEWVTRSENTLHAYKYLGKKPNKTMLGRTGYDCPNSKPINQLLKDGTFVKEYPSQHEAAKDLKLSQGNIGNVLAGRYKTTGGFKFQYV